MFLIANISTPMVEAVAGHPRLQQRHDIRTSSGRYCLYVYSCLNLYDPILKHGFPREFFPKRISKTK